MRYRPLQRNIREKKLHQNNAWNTYHTDNSCLASDMLRCPCKVSALKAKCPVFHISTTNSDLVNALGPKFSVGWLTAKLKLSLLAIVGPLGTSLRTLMTRWTGNTLYHSNKCSEHCQRTKKTTRTHVGESWGWRSCEFCDDLDIKVWPIFKLRTAIPNFHTPSYRRTTCERTWPELFGTFCNVLRDVVALSCSFPCLLSISTLRSRM